MATISNLRRSVRAWRGALLRAGRPVRRVVLLGVALGLAAGAVAQATTGEDALAHKPRFLVSTEKARPYLGSFKISHHGKGILGSTLRTGYNGNGYLQGTISVSELSEGQPTTFLATLYEYHSEGAKMRIDLWTPDVGSRLLGHLVVKRNSKDQLVGTLTLGQKRIAVTYKAVTA
jgi:hypothetical protein